MILKDSFTSSKPQTQAYLIDAVGSWSGPVKPTLKVILIRHYRPEIGLQTLERVCLGICEPILNH